MVAQGYVNVQKHPHAELYIYNYAPICQYEKIWNEATRACRGLILDKDMNIIARPFPKFFNYEEHQPHEIPNEPFEIFEKLDGSLGILYWIGDRPYIATRGSFNSDQAITASLILERYKDSFKHLRKDVTYLFEIIYPANRIVVDYGTENDIRLIAIINTATGEDVSLNEHEFKFPFRVNTKINGLKLGDDYAASLRRMNPNNSEGFVLRFKSGMRVKIKHEEYVRLHRILTNVSTINIWEYLKEGKDFNEILDRVPDEFYDWVKKTVSELKSKFDQIEFLCINEFSAISKHLGPNASRKSYAQEFSQIFYSSILFKMLDKQKYDNLIWKIVRPTYSKPFKTTV